MNQLCSAGQRCHSSLHKQQPAVASCCTRLSCQRRHLNRYLPMKPNF
jgi:hypothetical protein